MHSGGSKKAKQTNKNGFYSSQRNKIEFEYLCISSQAFLEIADEIMEIIEKDYSVHMQFSK